MTHQTNKNIKPTLVLQSNKQFKKPTNNNKTNQQNKLSKFWKSNMNPKIYILKVVLKELELKNKMKDFMNEWIIKSLIHDNFN